MHAKRIARQDLATRDGLNTSAHDFAVVRSFEQNKRDQRGGKGADFDRIFRPDEPRPDVWHQKVKPEDHQDERYRADQIHIATRYGGHRGEARQARQGKHGADNNPANHGEHGQLNGKRHAIKEQVLPGTPNDLKIEVEHICSLMSRADITAYAHKTWHLQLFFQHTHAIDHNDIYQDIGHRGHGKCFKDTKRELLHRPGGGGQLYESNGQCHRTVLDNIKEFGGEWRNNNPERHG